ncbi:protein of unknown function [Legionella longbeachae NSW150]|uniref:Uncharacterized protein n=1 Tax=Legionella longbeachae serogroup 1 (strain NSW150) TaxID=661367 RepID=D3HK21_LEGLN|nr:protein of unknown function [Legionella longbeachae NSW150]
MWLMVIFLEFTRNTLNHINNFNYFDFMLKIQSLIEMPSFYCPAKTRSSSLTQYFAPKK